MRSLRAELPSLKNCLIQVLAGRGGAIPPEVVHNYVYGIDRKCKFAAVHIQILSGVDWERVDGLGRGHCKTTSPELLRVDLDDATLELHHPQAVADHVYLAIDGLTAAVVNMTDTFARLINVVYGLKISERGASLFAVRDKCAPNSPLGSVLHDGQHCTWLKCVRELRGRCQHADVEEALLNPSGCFARRHEPHVPSVYCWQNPIADMPVTEYAKAAANAAETTLITAIRAVVAHSGNPVT